MDPRLNKDESNNAMALLKSIAAGNIDLSLNLIRAGAPANLADPSTGDTALHLAAAKNYFTLIDEIFRYQTKAMTGEVFTYQSSTAPKRSSLNNNGLTAAEVAANMNHWESVSALACEPDNPDEGDSRFDIALLKAAKANQTKTAMDLINIGVAGNAIDESNKFTVLHWAAYHSNYNLIAYFLSGNQNSFALDDKNKTAYQVCLKQKCWKSAFAFSTGFSTDNWELKLLPSLFIELSIRAEAQIKPLPPETISTFKINTSTNKNELLSLIFSIPDLKTMQSRLWQCLDTDSSLGQLFNLKNNFYTPINYNDKYLNSIIEKLKAILTSDPLVIEQATRIRLLKNAELIKLFQVLEIQQPVVIRNESSSSSAQIIGAFTNLHPPGGCPISSPPSYADVLEESKNSVNSSLVKDEPKDKDSEISMSKSMTLSKSFSPNK